MAKLPEYPTERYCELHQRHVTVTQHLENVQRRRGNGQPYWTTQYVYRASCGCSPLIPNRVVETSTPKDTKVTKQFDTTATKNDALNAIVNKVEAVERVLHGRAEARELLEAEHTKRIANASTELNRVIAEAYQSGLGIEDLELHLPEYGDLLTDRLEKVADIMVLDNALEGV